MVNLFLTPTNQTGNFVLLYDVPGERRNSTLKQVTTAVGHSLALLPNQ